MHEQPWYAEGLRFQCTQCGNCCTGPPGFVWVNQAEIKALAERLEMSVRDFEARYVRAVGIRKSLRERPNGDCEFLDADSRRCTVYDLRPRQCRTWPFWESNVRTPETWAETCRVCPGSGVGDVVTIDQIQANLGVIKV